MSLYFKIIFLVLLVTCGCARRHEDSMVSFERAIADAKAELEMLKHSAINRNPNISRQRRLAIDELLSNYRQDIDYLIRQDNIQDPMNDLPGQPSGDRNCKGGSCMRVPGRTQDKNLVAKKGSMTDELNELVRVNTRFRDLHKGMLDSFNQKNNNNADLMESAVRNDMKSETSNKPMQAASDNSNQGLSKARAEVNIKRDSFDAQKFTPKLSPNQIANNAINQLNGVISSLSRDAMMISKLNAHKNPDSIGNSDESLRPYASANNKLTKSIAMDSNVDFDRDSASFSNTNKNDEFNMNGNSYMSSKFDANQYDNFDSNLNTDAQCKSDSNANNNNYNTNDLNLVLNVSDSSNASLNSFTPSMYQGSASAHMPLSTRRSAYRDGGSVSKVYGNLGPSIDGSLAGEPASLASHTSQKAVAPPLKSYHSFKPSIRTILEIEAEAVRNKLRDSREHTKQGKNRNSNIASNVREDYSYNFNVIPEPVNLDLMDYDNVANKTAELENSMYSYDKIMQNIHFPSISNEQFDLWQNDLSHEADYKLSKVEQDAAERKNLSHSQAPLSRGFDFNLSRRNSGKKRAISLNPVDEVKLKTSTRLMHKGFGPSLPSYALPDTWRDIELDEKVKSMEKEYKNGRNRDRDSFDYPIISEDEMEWREHMNKLDEIETNSLAAMLHMAEFDEDESAPGKKPTNISGIDIDLGLGDGALELLRTKRLSEPNKEVKKSEIKDEEKPQQTQEKETPSQTSSSSNEMTAKIETTKENVAAEGETIKDKAEPAKLNVEKSPKSQNDAQVLKAGLDAVDEKSAVAKKRVKRIDTSNENDLKADLKAELRSEDQKSTAPKKRVKRIDVPNENDFLVDVEDMEDADILENLQRVKRVRRTVDTVQNPDHSRVEKGPTKKPTRVLKRRKREVGINTDEVFHDESENLLDINRTKRSLDAEQHSEEAHSCVRRKGAIASTKTDSIAADSTSRVVEKRSTRLMDELQYGGTIDEPQMTAEDVENIGEVDGPFASYLTAGADESVDKMDSSERNNAPTKKPSDDMGDDSNGDYAKQKFDNLIQSDEHAKVFDGMKVDNLWYCDEKSNNKNNNNNNRRDSEYNESQKNRSRMFPLSTDLDDNEDSNTSNDSNDEEEMNVGPQYKKNKAKVKETDDDGNGNGNGNNNGSGKKVILALRDQILNCTAFSNLESFLRTLQNKSTVSENDDGNDDNDKVDVNIKVKPVKPSSVLSDSTNNLLKSSSSSQKKNDMMKLNIAISASVTGDKRANKFYGNGTFKVQSEDRGRRDISFDQLDELREEYKRANKQRCENCQMENVANGKTSTELVKAMFNMVKSSSKFKMLWPSLRRNQLSLNSNGNTNGNMNGNMNGNTNGCDKSASAVPTSTNDGSHVEELVGKAMEALNDIVQDQKTAGSGGTGGGSPCTPLRPDLRVFYEQILQMYSNCDDKRNKRENFEKSETENSRQEGSFGSDNTMEDKSRIVKKLLRQYDTMPNEQQQQMIDLRDKLTQNLMYLREKQEQEQQERERDHESLQARDVVEDSAERPRRVSEMMGPMTQLEFDERQLQLDRQKTEAEMLKNFGVDYTPQYLKLLKASELMSENNNQQQQHN